MERGQSLRRNRVVIIKKSTRKGVKSGKSVSVPILDTNLLNDALSVSPFVTTPPELGVSDSMDLIGESSLDSYLMNETASIN